MILSLSLVLAAQAARPIEVPLTRQPRGLDWEGNAKARLGYRPSAAPLKDEDVRIPSGLVHARTAVFEAGSGASNKFSLAVVSSGFGASLYVDLNQNGRFDDDPPQAFIKQEGRRPGDPPSWRGTVVVPASYSAGDRVWRSPYGLNFYWWPTRPSIFFYRATSLVGTAAVNGESVPVTLYEDSNRGVFGDRYDTAANPGQTAFVNLILGEARVDPRGTFEYKGTNYLAEISVDGSRLVLVPTSRVVKAPARPQQPPQPALLAAGTPAPDFTVDAYAGGAAKLSDFKGRIVVLKFWATWCGPCIASMPHYEEIYSKTKDQDVAILAVCVSDERQAYKSWVDENKAKYTFPFYFDPAGRDSSKSISAKLYHVSGIPTVYVIDKEGRVVESIVGYGEGDKRLDQSLAKLGVKGF